MRILLGQTRAPRSGGMNGSIPRGGCGVPRRDGRATRMGHAPRMIETWVYSSLAPFWDGPVSRKYYTWRRMPKTTILLSVHNNPA